MIYYFTLAALAAVVFVNGWTDAPNAVATCVGSRSMTPRGAVALAAVCNLAGAVSACAIGGAVAESVYSIARFGDGEAGLYALCAGMSAVALWAVGAWYFGIPTSESHALIAGVSGAAVAANGFGALNPGQWGRVVAGLALSTLPAFAAGNVTLRLTAFLCRKRERASVLPFFIASQRAGAASGAFLHGLQDGQKFMGIYLLCVSLKSGGEWCDIPPAAAIFCAALMASGTAMGGMRIIKRVAFEMVSLDAPRGFAAELSASVCLGACTVLGLPVSTTHAKACAVMGAGSALRRGGLDPRPARDMLIAWVMTFPGGFALGWGTAALFRFII